MRTVGGDCEVLVWQFESPAIYLYWKNFPVLTRQSSWKFWLMTTIPGVSVVNCIDFLTIRKCDADNASRDGSNFFTLYWNKKAPSANYVACCKFWVARRGSLQYLSLGKTAPPINRWRSRLTKVRVIRLNGRFETAQIPSWKMFSYLLRRLFFKWN